MKKALWALALFAASVFGADFTGKFNGTLMIDGESHPAVVELKQDGDKSHGWRRTGSGQVVADQQCENRR